MKEALVTEPMSEAEHPLNRHPRESGDQVNTGLSVKHWAEPVAGLQPHGKAGEYWVPAFAGMTAEDVAIAITITSLSSQHCATIEAMQGNKFRACGL
jgi:hypothetical protein